MCYYFNCMFFLYNSSNGISLAEHVFVSYSPVNLIDYFLPLFFTAVSMRQGLGILLIR